MKPRSSSHLILAVSLIAFWSLAMAEPAPASLPADVKTGATLYNLNTVRGLNGALQGYTAGSQIEVKAVRDSWISIEFQGSLKKETWLNFDHVVSYRTKR